MASHRLEDHETPSVEAAAGFERYHEPPAWERGVLASDMRLERGDEDPWEGVQRRTGGNA